MKKVERETVQAFYDGREIKHNNSRVTVEHIKGRMIVSYLLHSNLIAQRVYDSQKLTSSLFIEDGGWQSVTTKSRLNAILRFYNAGYIYQKDFVWYYVDTYGNEYSFDDSPSVANYNNRSGFYIGEFS